VSAPDATLREAVKSAIQYASDTLSGCVHGDTLEWHRQGWREIRARLRAALAAPVSPPVRCPNCNSTKNPADCDHHWHYQPVSPPAPRGEAVAWGVLGGRLRHGGGGSWLAVCDSQEEAEACANPLLRDEVVALVPKEAM